MPSRYDHDEYPMRRQAHAHSRDTHEDEEPVMRRRSLRRDEEDMDERPARSRANRFEDEEERPAVRPARRASRDEEEDYERPARRSSRDEDDEDRPAKKRSSRDEDEDRPAKKRPRDDEDEDRPARRPSRDEDEEDRPAKRAPAAGGEKSGRSAWLQAGGNGGGFQKEDSWDAKLRQLQLSKYPDQFIAIRLVGDPFAVRTHWVPLKPEDARKQKDGTVGKEKISSYPFICPDFDHVHEATVGTSCPHCHDFDGYSRKDMAYYVNAFVCLPQGNDGDAVWSEDLYVIKLKLSNLIQLREIIKLKKGIDPSDPDKGFSIVIKYNSKAKKAAEYWNVQFDEMMPLTKRQKRTVSEQFVDFAKIFEASDVKQEKESLTRRKFYAMFVQGHDEDGEEEGGRYGSRSQKLGSRRDADEEDERPAKKRPRDEDEDERPARRSSRDEEDEDERPAKKRPRDEDEDERPARRSSRDADEEDERPARKRPRDDEEDERPARRSARDLDDEEERPAKKRPRFDEEDEERPARRSSRDADEDEPRPRKSRRYSDDEDAPRARR